MSPFYGLEISLEMLMKFRTFYHLYTTGYQQGVIYHFPNCIIQFEPINAHCGKVKIKGIKWRVLRVREELVTFLRHFEKNRYGPKFKAQDEIRDYTTCEFFFELENPPLFMVAIVNGDT